MKSHASTGRQANSKLILVLILVSFSVYLFMIFYVAFPFKFTHFIDNHEHDVRMLYNLVDIQNKTINSLMRRMKSLPHLLNLYEAKKPNTDVITTILRQQTRFNNHMTSTEQECESRYGLQLVNQWRNSEELWCSTKDKRPGKSSSLKCYPFQQKHRAEVGKGKDMFCVAENFIIDFSLVRQPHC